MTKSRSGPTAARSTLHQSSHAPKAGKRAKAQRVPQSERIAPVAVAQRSSSAPDVIQSSTTESALEAPSAKQQDSPGEKGLHVTRREQRILEQKAFRQLQAKARFTDLPAPEVQPQIQPQAESPEHISRAQARRFEQAQQFDGDAESGGQSGDIRPVASQRDMKRLQQQNWKQSQKNRDQAIRRDRDMVAL